MTRDLERFFNTQLNIIHHQIIFWNYYKFLNRDCFETVNDYWKERKRQRLVVHQLNLIIKWFKAQKEEVLEKARNLSSSRYLIPFCPVIQFRYISSMDQADCEIDRFEQLYDIYDVPKQPYYLFNIEPKKIEWEPNIDEILLQIRNENKFALTLNELTSLVLFSGKHQVKGICHHNQLFAIGSGMGSGGQTRQILDVGCKEEKNLHIRLQDRKGYYAGTTFIAKNHSICLEKYSGPLLSV